VEQLAGGEHSLLHLQHQHHVLPNWRKGQLARRPSIKTGHLLVGIGVREEILFMQTDTMTTTSPIIIDKELFIYPAWMNNLYHLRITRDAYLIL
jgi:hypothetical protein